MAFSSRSNPRLGQSGTSLSSLGAVGGPRGVAAGGLRVLVEFLTSYNPEAAKKLERDLLKLQSDQRRADRETAGRQSRITANKNKIKEIDISINKLESEHRSELKKIWDLETSRFKSNQQQAVNRAKILRQEIEGYATTKGLSQEEVDLLFTRVSLEREINHQKDLQAAAEGRTAVRAEKTAAVEAELLTIQQARSTLAAKLTGLAIGAVGGLVGGAVLGAGFQLADEALRKVGDAIQDIIDPARHAREEVAGLANEIEGIASEENISNLQAAIELLKQFGNPEAETQAPGLLAAAEAGRLLEEAEKYRTILDAINNAERLNADAKKALTDVLLQEAEANDTLNTSLNWTWGIMAAKGPVLNREIEGQEAEAYVLDRVKFLLDEYNLALLRAAQSQLNLERATALSEIAQENFASAVAHAISVTSQQTSAQIEALGTGVSAKTKRLQGRLANAQKAGSGGSNRSAQLANFAEERALILLRQRLRLLGTNIRLEKYSGKFLLEAINAKIAALQKEGREQDRINKLLDLRYKMSQTIERQQGESISDFLARRAQEQRKLLSEQDSLERQSKIDRLNDKKQEVEDQIALDELAAKKAEALRQSGTNSAAAHLAKRLAASQKHDAKVLAAQKKALQDEQKAREKAFKEALELTEDATVAKLRLAIAGANSVQDLEILGGRIAGYYRAKSTIQALVEGFGLHPSIAAGLIAKINGLISAYEAKESRIRAGRIRGPLSPFSGGFAEGGVFALKNSQAIFGQNVKTGEQGTEIGVILSNRVTNELRKARGADQIGPFIIQKSDDPLRDRYAFGKLVEGALEAALK